MTKATTLSFLLLGSLAISADAASTYNAQPGRHAPPYLASKLGNHKRSAQAWLDRIMSGQPASQHSTAAASQTPAAGAPSSGGAYYGNSYGLVSLLAVIFQPNRPNTNPLWILVASPTVTADRSRTFFCRPEKGCRQAVFRLVICRMCRGIRQYTITKRLWLFVYWTEFNFSMHVHLRSDGLRVCRR